MYAKTGQTETETNVWECSADRAAVSGQCQCKLCLQSADSAPAILTWDGIRYPGNILVDIADND